MALVWFSWQRGTIVRFHHNLLGAALVTQCWWMWKPARLQTADLLPHKFLATIVWEGWQREQDDRLVCGKVVAFLPENVTSWVSTGHTWVLIDRWGKVLSHREASPEKVSLSKTESTMTSPLRAAGTLQALTYLERYFLGDTGFLFSSLPSLFSIIETDFLHIIWLWFPLLQLHPIPSNLHSFCLLENRYHSSGITIRKWKQTGIGKKTKGRKRSKESAQEIYRHRNTDICTQEFHKNTKL